MSAVGKVGWDVDCQGEEDKRGSQESGDVKSHWALWQKQHSENICLVLAYRLK